MRPLPMSQDRKSMVATLAIIWPIGYAGKVVKRKLSSMKAKGRGFGTMSLFFAYSHEIRVKFGSLNINVSIALCVKD